MKKSTTVLDTIELHSFYRPHKRVQYTGELVNPVTGECFVPERRVKQSFVAECDINNILKQYKQTGQIAHMSANAALGAYQDLPDSMDFQEAINAVLTAQAAFASLPSKVRDRFENDPEQFLSFLHDPANKKEAQDLGLLKPVPAPVEPGTGGAGGKIPPAGEAAAAAAPHPDGSGTPPQGQK